jgi:hypothetical protein
LGSLGWLKQAKGNNLRQMASFAQKDLIGGYKHAVGFERQG